MQAPIKVRLPIHDFSQHLVNKFENLGDAHLLIGSDDLGDFGAVHVHRSILKTLQGKSLSVEIPSLGGFADVAIDGQSTSIRPILS